jgi:hypothetical protein
MHAHRSRKTPGERKDIGKIIHKIASEYACKEYPEGRFKL